MDSTEADLSILITDDASIRELNARWRGRDAATDVLSFSQLEGEGPSITGGPRVLGDVVISMETAARQAEAAGLSLDEEVQRLLIHGVLHLVGYDHERGEADAHRMQAEEGRILGLLAEADRQSEPKR